MADEDIDASDIPPLPADFFAKASLKIPVSERDSWFRLSIENLERAYGDDEPEYSLEDVSPKSEDDIALP